MARIPVPAPGVGWFPSMSMEDYLRIDAWHKGHLRDLYAGWPAAQIAHDLTTMGEEKETDERANRRRDFGTAAHLAISDLPDFKTQYGAFPDGDGRTAAVKQAKAIVVERGQKPIRQADYDGCLKVRARVLAHPLLGGLLKDPKSEREVTGVWRDADTGLVFTFRSDLQHRERGVILDWKTAEDPRTAPFMRLAWDKGYVLGCHHYAEGAARLGMEEPQVVLVAIQSEPPYLVNVVLPDEASLEAAGRVWEKAVDLLAEAVDGDMKGDRFPEANADGISIGHAPGWALKEVNAT